MSINKNNVLNEAETNNTPFSLPQQLERLSNLAISAQTYVPPFVKLLRHPDSLAVSIRTDFLCQAFDLVLRQHFKTRQYTLSYRTNPHTVIITYTVLKTFKLEARIENFHTGFSLRYDILQPTKYIQLLPLVELHLKNFEQNAPALLEKVKIIYSTSIENNRIQ